MFHDLVGKPFKDLGRGPDYYDCWGVVIEVSRRLGIIVPDYLIPCHDYGNIVQAYSEFSPEYEEVKITQPGDIVLYKRIGEGLHFGVVIDDLHFLHCTEELGVQENRMDHPLVKQLIKGFYRCKTKRIP